MIKITSNNIGIKLIAIDLDGTLLDENHKVSELNKKAIALAREKNMKVVLCSGRTVHNLLYFAKELEIYGEENYVAGFNGAGVARLSDEEFIFNESFTGKDAKHLARVCEEVDANFSIHTMSEAFTPRENFYSTHEATTNGVPLKIMHPRELNDHDTVTKLLILDEPKVIDGYEEYIREQMGEQYDVVRTMPMYLEVLKKGINKYHGIMAIAKRHEIKEEEIMAIGDAPNDLALLKAAGIAMAMGNGEEIIKEHADFITLSNEESGVAYALNYFLDLGN